MLNCVLLFSFITLALFYVIDITYRCTCDSINYAACNRGYHCGKSNGTCYYVGPETSCYYYYLTGKYCGEFQNCENSKSEGSCCPSSQEYCDAMVANECVPYRSDLCSNYTTKDTCSAQNSQCQWNDKNKCIARRSIRVCVDFNFYDMTSQCEMYDDCILDNGKCRGIYCAELTKKEWCSQETINRTHIKPCYWKDGTCREVTDLSIFQTEDDCFGIKQAIFVNSKCQFCNKLIQDSDLVQKYCYKDYYYTKPCLMDNLQPTTSYQQNNTNTNSSSTTTNSTSSNQTTTENPSSTTNSTTEQNSQNSTSNPSANGTAQTNTSSNTITQTWSIMLQTIIIASILVL